LRLRAATQQHGPSGKVLRRPAEKWRSVSFGIRVDVRASGGASDVVGLRHTHRQWLVCSRSALAPVAIALTGLPLHKNILRRASIVVPFLGLPLHRHALCRLSIAGLGIHAELLV
jgi:hypothetical protein